MDSEKVHFPIVGRTLFNGTQMLSLVVFYFKKKIHIKCGNMLKTNPTEYGI